MQSSQSSSQNNDETFLLNEPHSLHYEELSNPKNNSVTCPTCRGLGRLPKQSTSELVALVPYSDSRLQPSYTKSWISLGIALTAILFISAAYILVPRSVAISEPSNPQTVKSVIKSDPESLNLDLRIFYLVRNDNFYPISLNGLHVDVLYQKTVVKSQDYEPKNMMFGTIDKLKQLPKLPKMASISIPPRDQKEIQIDINDILFSASNHLEFIKRTCEWDWKQYTNVDLSFQSMLNITYWFKHSEMIHQIVRHRVDCARTD